MFEEETGIKVVYDEFETNEIMYPKVEAGSSAYDVVCPSDYMVQKMIENDLIQELITIRFPMPKKTSVPSTMSRLLLMIPVTNIVFLIAGEL